MQKKLTFKLLNFLNIVTLANKRSGVGICTSFDNDGHPHTISCLGKYILWGNLYCCISEAKNTSYRHIERCCNIDEFATQQRHQLFPKLSSNVSLGHKKN